MFKSNEQFTATNKATINTLLTVANTSFATMERLAALNLNTARALLADSTANVGALLAIKDAQGLLTLQSSLAKPVLENAVAYSRSVYEILSQSANGLSQIAESQVADAKKNFTAAIDQSLKNAPAGSEAVVAAMKSGLAAVDSAYGTMTNAAKQASASFEANIASANAATDKLIAKAA